MGSSWDYGADEGAGPVLFQSVGDRGSGDLDGIERGLLGMGISAPSISNEQNDGGLGFGGRV